MLSPLISAKVRSTARRSAPWKSRLTGCPLYCFPLDPEVCAARAGVTGAAGATSAAGLSAEAPAGAEADATTADAWGAGADSGALGATGTAGATGLSTVAAEAAEADGAGVFDAAVADLAGVDAAVKPIRRSRPSAPADSTWY